MYIYFGRLSANNKNWSPERLNPKPAKDGVFIDEFVGFIRAWDCRDSDYDEEAEAGGEGWFRSVHWAVAAVAAAAASPS